jgi:hypothetical protein
MFGLDKSNAQITHLNLRAEKHGDGNEPACDIKVSVDIPAERLDDIHPGLCESLYRKPSAGDQMPLVEVGKKPPAGFTVVRHPGLEPLQLKQKFPGYELRVRAPSEDADEDGELFFADGEVKNFTITVHEGGTTNVKFSVGTHVDEDDIAGLLPFLRDPDAVITLTPPKPQAQRAAGATETCESGDPACGPAEYHDADGVPLCKACYEALDTTGADPDDGEEAQPAEDIPAAA